MPTISPSQRSVSQDPSLFSIDPNSGSINGSNTLYIVFMSLFGLMICFISAFCCFMYYKRKKIQNGIDDKGKTPYERWMAHLEEKQSGPYQDQSISTSSHRNPMHSTTTVSVAPPPPPPAKNPLPLPRGRSPLPRSRHNSIDLPRPSHYSSSMRRSSERRRSSSGYGSYDIYGSNDRVISSSNPLHD
jgi:hypothetical protein